MFDDDEDHQRYHDHLDVYGVYQHDRDRVKRYLKKKNKELNIDESSSFYIPRSLFFFVFLFKRELRAEPRAAILFYQN